MKFQFLLNLRAEQTQCRILCAKLTKIEQNYYMNQFWLVNTGLLGSNGLTWTQMGSIELKSLCSRNFQKENLRLDFVEI